MIKFESLCDDAKHTKNSNYAWWVLSLFVFGWFLHDTTRCAAVYGCAVFGFCKTKHHQFRLIINGWIKRRPKNAEKQTQRMVAAPQSTWTSDVVCQGWCCAYALWYDDTFNSFGCRLQIFLSSHTTIVAFHSSYEVLYSLTNPVTKECSFSDFGISSFFNYLFHSCFAVSFFNQQVFAGVWLVGWAHQPVVSQVFLIVSCLMVCPSPFGRTSAEYRGRFITTCMQRAPILISTRQLWTISPSCRANSMKTNYIVYITSTFVKVVLCSIRVCEQHRFVSYICEFE